MMRRFLYLILVAGLSLGSLLFPRAASATPLRVSPKALALSHDSEKKTSEKETSEKKKKKKSEPPELTGKYLVGDPISIRDLIQTFEPKICSGASDPNECRKLDQPPTANSFFHLTATDDSDRKVPVNAKLISGQAVIYPYDGTRGALRVLPKSAGKLVLLLTAQAAGYSPMVATIYVANGAGDERLSCARLFPPAFKPVSVIDSSMIIRVIGTPQPYVLEAATDDKILIYSIYPPRDKSQPIRKQILDDIKDQIRKLSARKPKDLGLNSPSPFTVELTVPHADALGDLGAKIASLNSKLFSATRIGTDKIRVTAADQPECGAWNAYLANLQHLVWGLSPESPAVRLFYTDAGDVSKAVSAGGGGAAASSGTPASQSGSTGSGTAGQPAAASGGSTPAPPKDSPLPSKTFATVSALKDMLVFNDANPGDDADVVEKKRLIALLDLPRPEMIVNAWVMQNSSKDPKLVSGFSDTVARTVSAFNDALEKSIARAWSRLSEKVNNPDAYFDEGFYRYIAKRYVGELPYGGFPISAGQGAQEVLELRSDAKLSDPDRERYGACGANEYCLGYRFLFDPRKPRLTDLLMAVIAAKDPPAAVTDAIKAIETVDTDAGKCISGDHPDYCAKLRSQLRIPDSSTAVINAGLDCRKRDLIAIHKTASYDGSPVLHLECFKDKALNIFGSTPGIRSQVGLLRAAIADFLFNYKISQQYPHEFSAYELSESADMLNAALSPFIEAFNQDLKAFQEFLQEDLRYRVENLPGASGGWFSSGKQSFINNGIVSVRTISGKPATVDTTSQSFLDASSAPQFADLAKSIVDQTVTKGASGDPAGVLGNLSSNQAQVILGALQAFKPTTVQIGRGLTLKIDPRSLSAASAAEIDVTLNADESAAPTYFGGPKGAQEPNTSRVAKHDTSTRVRVDSIKLFEVSSFSAELQRSRSRFPLLPPFVEIPYIGTLIGIPLPPAKEYHTSTAVLSAIVVPTAADLAYGLVFNSDRILDSGGWRKALFLRDLYQPVRSFNKEKISCISALQSAPARCRSLSFDDMLREPGDRRGH